MAPIRTYVFFNLGTTGLLDTDPKITELHMILIQCKDLKRYFREREEENLEKPPIGLPFHWRREDDISREDYVERSFMDEAVVFLASLEKPVCLIAHNGNRFGFPLLLAKLKHVEDFSPKDIVCADSMAAFYDILEPDAAKTSNEERKRGCFPWPDDYYQRKKYDLKNLFGTVCLGAVLENAEDRNNAQKKLALTEGFEFMLWVAENNCPLTSFFGVN